MKRIVQENIMAGILVCFFVWIIVLSLEYGPRARLVPIPISVMGLILLVGQIVWQNLRPEDELHVDVLEFLTKRGIDVDSEPDSGAESGQDSSKDAAQLSTAAVAVGDPTQDSERSRKNREVIAFGKVVILMGLFFLLGPFPSVFIFTFGYFGLSRHYSWPKSFLITSIFTAIVYGLFVEVLQIQLYHGILEPFIINY